MPNIQTGYCCEVQVTSPTTIEKTSLRVYSQADAERIARDLVTYDQQLQAEPLDTTPLLDVDLVPVDGGFRVRHSTELVDELSLAELVGEDRVDGFRRVIGQLAEMSTFSDGDTLVVPVDAYPPNFHGGKLIDLYPPVPRRADGSMPLENIPMRATRLRATRDYGQKTGAIVQLLATGVVGQAGHLGRLGHALRQTDDWCYDALPNNLTGRNRDVVRREISRRFLPFIVRQGMLRRIAPGE